MSLFREEIFHCVPFCLFIVGKIIFLSYSSTANNLSLILPIACVAAISCAERGLKSHLLLRGEQPETLTGYNLISSLYGNVSYVERSLYARREDMLARHANSVTGSDGTVQQLDDFWEASFRNDASKNLSFPEMTVPRSIRNFKKVAVINEGASEAIGLLGTRPFSILAVKCCIMSLRSHI